MQLEVQEAFKANDISLAVEAFEQSTLTSPLEKSVQLQGQILRAGHVWPVTPRNKDRGDRKRKATDTIIMESGIGGVGGHLGWRVCSQMYDKKE